MLRIVTLLATLVIVSSSPVEARQKMQCETTEQVVEVIEKNQWSHVVLRDVALKGFVEFYNSVPGDQIENGQVDFIIVVSHEATGRALVFFGKGNQVCHYLPIPMNIARRYMTGA